jgi:hypothetical protein
MERLLFLELLTILDILESGILLEKNKPSKSLYRKEMEKSL